MAELWWGYLSWFLVKILRPKLGRDFEAEIWLTCDMTQKQLLVKAINHCNACNTIAIVLQLHDAIHPPEVQQMAWLPWTSVSWRHDWQPYLYLATITNSWGWRCSPRAVQCWTPCSAYHHCGEGSKTSTLPSTRCFLSRPSPPSSSAAPVLPSPLASIRECSQAPPPLLPLPWLGESL